MSILTFLCILVSEDLLNAVNLDIEYVVMPVDTKRLEKLLIQPNYPEQERSFLVQGFREGFDLMYEGPTARKDTVKNIPFTVCSSFELWQKIIKEVKMKR